MSPIWSFLLIGKNGNSHMIYTWEIHGQLSPTSSQNTSHNSSVRARYGKMYFVGSNRKLYSASVTVTIYAISCYTGSRHNGTRLYMKISNIFVCSGFGWITNRELQITSKPYCLYNASMAYQRYSAVPLKPGQLPHTSSQNTPHSSPMYFVSSTSD